jgi:hypothetical protein
MIFLQRPDATLVAGFNHWKSLGRVVKKGERRASRSSPRAKYKTKIETEDGDERTVQRVRDFRVVHVFDISQTEGEDLPDLEALRPKPLDGDAPQGIWDALVRHANSIGFEGPVMNEAVKTAAAISSRSRSQCVPMSRRRKRSRH